MYRLWSALAMLGLILATLICFSNASTAADFDPATHQISYDLLGPEVPASTHVSIAAPKINAPSLTLDDYDVYEKRHGDIIEYTFVGNRRGNCANGSCGPQSRGEVHYHTQRGSRNYRGLPILRRWRR